MTEDEMAGCITDSMDMSLSELWVGLQRLGHNRMTFTLGFYDF